VVRTALLTGAVALAVVGFWIPIKAELAQVLIQRAWDARREGDAPRPWPWADTEPVGELRHDGRRWIVLAGASGRTLAFGPGHIDGTARPGQPGRIGIAGHRDTHFRFLKDLKPGEQLELAGRDGRWHGYEVRAARVVHESETRWLEGSEGLVLVTCYPFDAVVPGGKLRYLVFAEPTGGEGRRGDVESSSRAGGAARVDRRRRATGPLDLPVHRSSSWAAIAQSVSVARLRVADGGAFTRSRAAGRATCTCRTAHATDRRRPGHCTG